MEPHLDIFIGCMRSEKSTCLLRKLTKFNDIGLQVVYINHSIDTRSEKAYSTHSTLIKNSKLEFDSMKLETLENPEKFSQYDVVGIDEASLFGPELVDFVLKLVEVYHKYVIVVGLDSTFERKKFGYILDLIPYADNVTKLHAYCKKCADHRQLKSAIFTHRISESKETVVIGADDYVSVCRKCYLEATLVAT